MEFWTLLLRSLVGGLFLRNTWLDSGYMFLVSAWTNFLHFLVNESLDPVVDSRLALRGDFPGLQLGEVCTADASIAWTARAYGTWNLDIISLAPRIRQAL